MSIPISIGMQCVSAGYLKDRGHRQFSFPFDWIISNPKFVYDMLDLLIVKKMDITKLVGEHFYVLDKKLYVDPNDPEHYVTIDDSSKPYNCNSKYNAVYPHDCSKDLDETIQKYCRRFNRLKEHILNKNIWLEFYYTSPSSRNKGNFTVDGNDVILNVAEYMKKIGELIMSYHGPKFRIIIFDSFNDVNVKKLGSCPNMCVYNITPKDRFYEMIPEMISLRH